MKKRKNKLDQVTNALKNEPILAGPSQELIDATLAKLAAEAEKAPPEPVEPVKTTNLTKRFAAVAVAAAIIFVVALIAVKTLTGPDEVPAKQTAQQPPVEKTLVPGRTTPEFGPATVASLDAELESILQMAIANDIDGLVAMLTEGQPQSRLIAANILSIVGDMAAIPALEKLSTEYGKDKPNNPFAAAIDNIKTRLESPATASIVTIKAQIAKFIPKGVLSGLITDAKTGRPISDVKVDTWIGRFHTTVTDANGFYYFDKITEPGSYKIKVSSLSHIGILDWDKLPIVELSKDTQVVKHFALEPACQIDIQVINEQNEPVEKVRIIAASLADQRSRQINDSGYAKQTDKDGMFTHGGFAPAKTPYLITATHDDYAPAKLLVTLNDTGVIEFGEITMKKGISVRGYAEYSDGVPAGGLSVSPYPDWWHCNYGPKNYPIDPNGYFTLSKIEPGIYNINIYTPRSEGGGGSSYQAGQASLPLEEGLLIVKVRGKSPGSLASISGTVIFAEGKRPSSVSVSANSPQDRGYHGTDIFQDQNTFMIGSLEPNLPYTVTFSGSNVEQKILKDIKPPVSGLEVELKYIDKPRLQGAVVNSDTQEPIRQFKARIRKLRSLSGSNYTQSDRWQEFNNPLGEFDIEAVGPGVYQVQIAADGFAWLWSEEINTGQNQPILVELAAGGSIKGSVLNEKGQPVSGALVIPLSKAGGAMPRVKDVFVSQTGAARTVNGKFTLNDLPQGTETIKVTHPDYSPTIVKNIEVTQDQITEDIEVILTKGATVEGYVYDAQGKPQPNVTLIFQDQSGYGGGPDEKAGQLAVVVTDAKGFYRVEGLPEKMCHVRRSNEWNSLGVVKRALVPQNGKTIELNFGGKPTITGQVIIDAEPLKNTKLMLGGPSNYYSSPFTCYAMTDSDGRFSFGGAPDGRYAIYHELPDKQYRWTKITTFDAGREDMDLGVVTTAQSARILISLNPADPNDPLEDMRIYLRQGTEFVGNMAGSVTAPVKKGDPYIVTDILPGTYTINASRSDRIMIREAIELEADTDELKVTLQIPKGTASISGRFVSDSEQSMLIMYRSDEKLLASIRPGNDGTYKVENLPPGEYTIRNSFAMLYSMDSGASSVTFTLADGENKTLDIDYSDFDITDISFFHTQVIGENGMPLSDPDIWLEGPTGTIEPAKISLGQGQLFVVEPGEYTLHATYPGYKQATKALQLKANDITAIQRQDSAVLIQLEKQ